MKLIATDGRQYDLNQPTVTVGRAPENTIVINDSRISGHHARFTQDGGAYLLLDLASTNGTAVNNIRLTGPHHLQPRDVISLGGYILTVAGSPGISPTVKLPEDMLYSPPPTPAYSPPTPMYNAPAIYNPPPGYAPYPPTGTKDRSLAYILEIGPGLFGFIGFGWIYTNQTGAGLAFLLGNLVFLCISGILAAVTGGISLCLTWPVEIGVLLLSVILLSSHINQHPELFR
jgi:hypothetical protein